jgi:hypothetical protein
MCGRCVKYGGETRYIKDLGGKPEGKKESGRYRYKYRQHHNIKMDHQKV